MGRSNRANCVLCGIATALTISAGARAHAAGAKILDVQVTQGIQSLTGNTVPMLSGRPVAMRVKVDPAAAGTKVSGKLSIVRNNLFVVQDLPPMNAPFEVPSEATLYELGGTLNFRSPELAQMIGGSIEFRIDLTDASGSTVFDHWSRMFWLHPPVPLRVYWLAVALPPQRGKSAEVMPADVKPGTADAFLRATFPIADDPSCCEWLDTDPLEYTGDLGANEKVDVGDEADDLVLAISQYIDLIDDPSLPEGTYRRVFGWIPEDSAVSTQRRLAFYGWSDRKESACATTLPLEFQATLAHELAHTFGEGESSENSPAEDSISPGVGFDPGDRLFGNPASNAVPESTRFFKPDTSNGMMTPGCKAWESWIGESCYWRLLRFAPSPVEIDPNPFAFARSAAFILRGTFTRGVIHAPKVRLVVKVPYPPPPEPHFPPKPFHAASIECIGEIVYRTARVDGLRNVSLSVRPGKSGLEVTQSVRFAATPSAGSVEAATDGPNQSAAERDLHFVARFAVPQDAVVDRIRILDADTREVVFEQVRGPDARAPHVVELNAVRDTDRKGAVRVAWRVEDDGDPGRITCNVAWSRDGGHVFMPLRVQQRSPNGSYSFTFEPPAAGSRRGNDCVIRVFASDGLDTDMADSPHFQVH